MSDYQLRNMTGQRLSPTAKRPGTPGTRQYNRLKSTAEHYHGRGPTDAALASEKLPLEIYEEVMGVPVFGEPAEEFDPADLIVAELRRSAGYVRDLEALVRKMESDDLIEDDVVQIDEEKSGDGEGNTYTLTRTERRKEINRLWTLFERERKHLAGVANAAVRAGLEVRRIRIAEAQVDRVQATILQTLSSLGIDTDSTQVRTAIGANIKALQAGNTFEPDAIAVPSEREPIPVRRTPPPPPAEF